MRIVFENSNGRANPLISSKLAIGEALCGLGWGMIFASAMLVFLSI